MSKRDNEEQKTDGKSETGKVKSETADGIADGSDERDDMPPVYRDLHDLAEKHHISSDGQAAISEVITGNKMHWHQISKQDAVEVLTEIQINGVADLQQLALQGNNVPEKSEKGEHFAKLLKKSVDNDLSDHQQKKITEKILGRDGVIFPELTMEDADTVYNAIQDKGITYWINEGASMHPEKMPSEGVGEALSHVLDDETGKMIAVDEDMINQLQSAEGWMVISEFIKWIQLAIIQDERLYTVRECTSMEEYTKLYLPDSYGHVKKMISVGRAFKGAFGEGAPVHLLEDGKMKVEVSEEMSSQLQGINEIGITKLYELTKLPDADFSEVMSHDVVKLKDGREIPLSEIREESAREVERKVREVKKTYQKRVANLQEDKKKFKEERDQWRKQFEENEDAVERAKNMEEKYGKKAARMEEIDYLLDKTEDGLHKIEESFGKVEVEYSDPEALRERVMTLLRRMTLVQEAAITRYPWLQDMDELSLFPAHKLADGITDESDLSDAEERMKIRMDKSAMAIKSQSFEGPYSHGWKHMEKGFESVEEMEERFNELMESDQYEEG